MKLLWAETYLHGHAKTLPSSHVERVEYQRVEGTLPSARTRVDGNIPTLLSIRTLLAVLVDDHRHGLVGAEKLHCCVIAKAAAGIVNSWFDAARLLVGSGEDRQKASILDII